MVRVAAMMVVLVMLVVVVAEAYEPEPPDSFKPATPSLSPPPTDAPNEGTDCGPMCDAMCSTCKDPKEKEDCLNNCKPLCKQPHPPVIFACSFACADTMSSKFASANGKGEYIEKCYKMCKKNV